MRSDKYNRIINTAQYHRGPQTVAHVLSTVTNDPEIAALPGRIIGKIANIRHNAYIEGKINTIEIIDGCAYIDGVGLIPLDILRGIKITCHQTRKVVHSDNPSHSYNWHAIYRDKECTQRVWDRSEAMYLTECYYTETTATRQYTLDQTEQF